MTYMQKGYSYEEGYVHINQGKDMIQPELHGQFIEFLGSCIYDGIWVGEDSKIPNYDVLLMYKEHRGGRVNLQPQ